MKIGIQTWGSDGDVRPFIALAGGLQAAGHDVTLAYTSLENKDYSELADILGISLIQVGMFDYSPEEIKREISSMFRINNPVSQILVLLKRFLEPVVPEMYKASMALCQDNDLVLSHMFMYPLRAASDKTGCPNVTVFQMPMIPTRYMPPIGAPDFGQWLNPLVWKIAGFVMNRTMLPLENKLRKDLGLAPMPGMFDYFLNSKHMNLIAVSPSFIERPSDWEEHQKICGFFNMPPANEPWEMPPELKSFIEGGPPPVYITFGSMLAIDEAAIEQSTRIMVDAARMSGCRAIVQTVWEGIGEFAHQKDIYFIRKAPHQNIFPLCSAVVHHGGAGSTQTATLAGCPSIVVPYGFDQPFWAGVLQGLGIAPKPLPRLKLTAQKLAHAIKLVLNNPEMKQKAESIALKIRDEDGVSNAVKIIEEQFLT